MRRLVPLLLALALALPSAAAARSCIVAGGPEVTEPLVKAANAFRRGAGLPPLAASERLDGAAATLACDMARYDFFGHVGHDGSTVMDRVRSAGYRRPCVVAENIASGYTDPRRVVAGWRGSAGHRANLLNREVREVGAAFTEHDGRRYWVMVFAASCG
jgi:uncharacterized protein YkwD